MKTTMNLLSEAIFHITLLTFTLYWTEYREIGHLYTAGGRQTNAISMQSYINWKLKRLL